jgi:hypothetical protein
MKLFKVVQQAQEFFLISCDSSEFILSSFFEAFMVIMNYFLMNFQPNWVDLGSHYAHPLNYLFFY